MIYDSRTDTVKLHHKDKVYLAGALGVVRAYRKCTGDERLGRLLTEMEAMCGLTGVAGDEHLKRAEKEPEPKAATQKRLNPEDDGVTPPY